MRHLHDPRELRRNPLAVKFFELQTPAEACTAIRRRAQQVLQSLSSPRAIAILERADMLRHPPGTVARDLGISKRQYQRERRSALETFFTAFASRSPIATRSNADDAAAALRTAAALADSGETWSARAILHEIACLRGDAQDHALVRLALIELWDHRFDRAEDLLRFAGSGAANDAVNAARVTLRSFRDGPGTFEKSQFDGYRSTIACAEAAFLRGDAAAAHHLLGGANDDGSEQNADARIDALLMQAEIENFTHQDFDKSEASFAQAIAACEHASMLGRRAYALHHEALARWMRTRSANDRLAYRTLVDSTEPALPRRQRMYLALTAADIETAIGSPRRALKAASTAAVLSANRYDRLSAEALAAAALLRCGDVDRARQQARFVAERARAAQYPRIVSLAQRVHAQTLLARRETRVAREAIEEACWCAKSHSSTYVLVGLARIRARIRAF